MNSSRVGYITALNGQAMLGMRINPRPTCAREVILKHVPRPDLDTDGPCSCRSAPGYSSYVERIGIGHIKRGCNVPLHRICR